MLLFVLSGSFFLTQANVLYSLLFEMYFSFSCFVNEAVETSVNLDELFSFCFIHITKVNMGIQCRHSFNGDPAGHAMSYLHPCLLTAVLAILQHTLYHSFHPCLLTAVEAVPQDASHLLFSFTHSNNSSPAGHALLRLSFLFAYSNSSNPAVHATLDLAVPIYSQQ